MFIQFEHKDEKHCSVDGEIGNKVYDSFLSLNANDTVSFNYPHNMRLVAQQLNCPLIDMTKLTRHLTDSLGLVKAGEFFYYLTNGTHFGT